MAILILGPIVAAVFRGSGTENSVAAANDTDSAAPTNESTPQQTAAKNREALAAAAGRALKQAVRNPDSLVIEEAYASQDGKLLCIRYRAQNGFGGMNRETMAWYEQTAHPSASFWNAHCVGSNFVDEVSSVKMGMSLAS